MSGRSSGQVRGMGPKGRKDGNDSEKGGSSSFREESGGRSGREEKI